MHTLKSCSPRRHVEARSLSPFVHEIQSTTMPKGLLRLQMGLYDGAADPEEHVKHFAVQMNVHSYNDAILCRVFPSTLEKAAMTWFISLKVGSVASFAQLCESFIAHFSGSRKRKKNMRDIRGIE